MRANKHLLGVKFS